MSPRPDCIRADCITHERANMQIRREMQAIDIITILCGMSNITCFNIDLCIQARYLRILIRTFVLSADCDSIIIILI